jgi:methylated-DNA-[protein]-cysteine S-methyltransferase
MHKRAIKVQHYKSPFGEMILGESEEKLCLCDWKYRNSRVAIDRRIQTYRNADYVEKNTPFLKEVESQLRSYFVGELKEFDIPIMKIGTEFQMKVWDALLQIPYGSTISYAALSAKIYQSDAIRAVANANGANALAIIIPCHRVIGSNGELTGYAGGHNVKEKLLALENRSHQLTIQW